MQLVGDRWYIRYKVGASVLAFVLLLSSIMLWVLPALQSYRANWGVLAIVTGVTSALQLLFTLFLYERTVKKTDYYQATAAISFIQALNVLSLINATGKLHSWFLILWAVVILASGSFGVVGLMCCIFMTALLYVFAISDMSSHAAVTDPQSLAALGAIAIVCMITYFLWRKQYVHEEAEAVAQLSGRLKTNQRQSEMLVESLSDGVLLVTSDGKISLMNPAAARMTGWPIDEGSGAGVQLVINLRQESGEELDAIDNPLLQLASTTTATTQTLQLLRRDKKQMTVSLVTSPVIDARTQKVTGTVVVLRDVSVARQEEKQRAEFISTASHEMRTPVAAIEGYLALAMNDKVAKIDAKARTYLEKAHESTQHLGKLFQDLLMSAKAEDGRLVSHPSVVEMGAYVEQLAESFRFAADKKGLLTDFVFGSSGGYEGGSRGSEHTVRPLYYVHVDPDRIREVITNLFDNAVKYTPSGKVSVGLTGNNDVVQVYVRDTGPGIPPEDVPHLFQKFYRVDNSATRTIGGTGLGLFICRKIVELYKGRIWAESKVGEGSTFYVNMPRLSSQQAAELQRKETQNSGPAPVTSLSTPV